MGEYQLNQEHINDCSSRHGDQHLPQADVENRGDGNTDELGETVVGAEE